MNKYADKILNQIMLICIAGLSTTVKFMPIFLIPVVSKFLELMLKVFARKEMRQFRENISKIFQLSSKSDFAKMFEKQCLKHLAVCTLETVRSVYDEGRLKISNYDDYRSFLEKIKSQGRGLIIITAHIGSWEILAQITARIYVNSLCVLAKPARFSAVTKTLEKFRNMIGARVLWNDSQTILRDMLGALKANNCIGFVMDQKPERRQGVPIKFFGYDAEFVTGPARVALKTNAPVVAAFCVRESTFTYKMVYEELKSDQGSLKDDKQLTEMMVAAIEKIIRCYPEQWTWNYRRWRF